MTNSTKNQTQATEQQLDEMHRIDGAWHEDVYDEEDYIGLGEIDVINTWTGQVWTDEENGVRWYECFNAGYVYRDETLWVAMNTGNFTGLGYLVAATQVHPSERVFISQ